MFGNYFKIAFRSLVKNRGYSFLNIFGLSIGMASAIIIFFFVRNELGYDTFFKNSDDIFRVITIEGPPGAGAPSALTKAPLAKFLKQNFSEIIDAACFNQGVGGKVKYKNRSFYEEYFCFTDQEFFNIFSFTFEKGDPLKALEDPYGAVISETIARKYFGSRNPIGEVLSIGNRFSVTVTGVLKVQKKTHLQLNLVLSNKLYKEFGIDINTWGRKNYSTYLLLRKSVEVTDIKEKINHKLRTFAHWGTASKIDLQPLKRIYLHSNFSQDLFAHTGSIDFIYMLFLIGIFILFIACFNFMNLATARCEKRLLEVGVRKAIGARYGQLFRQYMGETIIMALIALLLALIIVELTIPLIGKLFLHKLSFYQSLSPLMVLLIFGFAFFIGIMAGVYPAIFISSLNPVSVLKRDLKRGRLKGSLIRKILVIGQFSISVILIIVTLFLFRQFYFVKHKDLGYENEQLIYLRINPDIRDNIIPFGRKLMENYKIKGVSTAVELPHHELTGPMDLKLVPKEARYLLIRIKPMQVLNTINYIREKWSDFFAYYPFKFAFLNEKLDDLFRRSIILGKVITFFACIALFISCLGLFGLASFTTQQRTKEIGIRKVVGASGSNIFHLLSRQFLKWVLISNIIAWPIAFFAMSKWLQSYAFRINIEVWVFLYATVLAMIVALLAMSFQTIRAASSNPVEILRYE
jgi:ABC-type antimicrobial peptide transport system permease subunit